MNARISPADLVLRPTRSHTPPSTRISLVNSNIRVNTSDSGTGGRQQPVIHQMKTATLVMDNDDYP